jgi:hypothetical protein
VSRFGPSDIEVRLLEEVLGLFDSGIVLLQLGSRLTTKLGLERVDLLDERVDLSEAKAGPCELDVGLLEEVFDLKLDGSLITKFGLEQGDLEE